MAEVDAAMGWIVGSCISVQRSAFVSLPDHCRHLLTDEGEEVVEVPQQVGVVPSQTIVVEQLEKLVLQRTSVGLEIR